MSGLDAHLVVRRPRFVLDVEVSVAPGRTLALLGPNGAGKSTTLLALAGLISLDEGAITLDGVVLDGGARRFVPPERRRIGIVFQDYLLFPHMSVLENVAFGPRSHGLNRRGARQRAGEWLERLGLSDLAGRPPTALSGGQAQRVALARALSVEPAMLLLDEPLSALDVSGHAEMRRLLAHHLAHFDGPRLLITHDPQDAFILADEILVIENGTAVQRGTAEDIRHRPASAYVADVAGINLFLGTAEAGRVTITPGVDSAAPGSGTGTGTGEIMTLVTADLTAAGPVLVTIRPRSITLHRDRPDGSARNTWFTVVTAVESLGEVVRINLGTPLAVSVEVTPAAVAELDLAPGQPVWAAVKATDLTLSPS